MQVVPMLARRAARQAARNFSVLSSFPYDSTSYDTVVYPRKARGLDYDLNWSLAADALTTRGEAYRNASIRDLLEFAPRGSVKVTKERAVEIISGASAATEAFATDVLPGRKVMDVEEYEGRLTSLRDECLSYAPRLFVEDAALGSSRASELRVRVITDSPLVALYFRNLLLRTPLYNPEVFPRTLTVYAATLAGEGVAAARGTSGAYTVVDVDPQSSRGVVLSVGNTRLSSIAEAVATAASSLMSAGGYRHVKGGSSNAALTAARADGVLNWYMRDGHFYANASEAHPDLLAVKGDVVLGGDNKYALVVGANPGSIAGPAAAKGKLYAAHHAVWSADAGLSSVWGGVSMSQALAKENAKTLPLVRGAIINQGSVTLPLRASAKAVPPPSKIVLVSTSVSGTIAAADAVAHIKAASELTDKQAEKLYARLSAHKDITITAVPSAADALKILGL